MERMKIAALFADQEQLDGKEVTVCGWARTIRDMKTFGFIELNDGSCFKNLQVVMSADELNNYKEIAGQNVGAALIWRCRHGRATPGRGRRRSLSKTRTNSFRPSRSASR